MTFFPYKKVAMAEPAPGQRTIGEIAEFITSKNAGPYVVTIDIVFANGSDYLAFKSRNVLTPRIVAQLYGISESDVRPVIFFDPALAVKVALRRRVCSGAIGDSDVYGAQQHIPIMMHRIDWSDECATS